MKLGEQKFKYQVVVLGPGATRHGMTLKRRLRKALADLGENLVPAVGFSDASCVLHPLPKLPVVAVYYGGPAPSPADIAAVRHLKEVAAPVIPVVDDLAAYVSLVPQELHEINGLRQTPGAAGFDPLLNLILENLGLLRKFRRLFISYRRSDASTEALQLRHEFDSRGFDAFLDTHSVPKGDKFQQVLWQRLADSDVALVLDTKGFMESRWTKEELAQAEAMTIGIIQVIWPGGVPANFSELCERIYLTAADFNGDNGFASTAITRLADAAEHLRARSMAARHDNLTREFCDAARWVGVPATVQPERFIASMKRSGRAITAVPAVGVPDAPWYHETHLRFLSGAPTSEVWLLYDQRGLRLDWVAYLAFLNKHLPVKTVCITDTPWELAK